MIFVDTNVLMDILEDSQTAESDWSRRAFARAAADNRLVSNLIVASELSGQMANAEDLGATLASADVDLLDLDLSTAHRAGTAFRTYRSRGGARATILPDFLIAAHAAAIGATLLTRDRGIARYFPELSIIAPDIDNG